MNRERAAELLPIMQAYADGKEIQSLRHDDNWIDVSEIQDHVCFAAHVEYRIKPEPFECWVNEYSNGTKALWENEEDAKSQTMLKKGGRTIHMREVE